MRAPPPAEELEARKLTVIGAVSRRFETTEDLAGTIASDGILRTPRLVLEEDGVEADAGPSKRVISRSNAEKLRGRTWAVTVNVGDCSIGASEMAWEAPP